MGEQTRARLARSMSSRQFAEQPCHRTFRSMRAGVAGSIAVTKRPWRFFKKVA